MPTILVTGGAGFIGGHLVRLLLEETDARIVNLDLLTYAGRGLSLGDVSSEPRYTFARGDIADGRLVASLLDEHRPNAVFHLAAESHVDRSIDAPDAFARTNLLGTASLLQACLGYWEQLTRQEREGFRFVHVSTDEVFGDLPAGAPPFTESSPYQPSSPYAASKAGSDHLVRAFGRTYGLPAIVTNSSNNYGPGQLPEKMLPLMTLNALAGEPLPVYGDGLQRRDWLWVGDQCRALLAALERGQPGQSYNLGAEEERTNLEVVHAVCDLIDLQTPGNKANESRRLVEHVTDRPGHDRRYAINANKARQELGWRPQTAWEEGLATTVAWYAEHARLLTNKGLTQPNRQGLRATK